MDREAQIAELEAFLANPVNYEDMTQLEVTGERHRVLGTETQALWEEWERVASEAERVGNQLGELDAP